MLSEPVSDPLACMLRLMLMREANAMSFILYAFDGRVVCKCSKKRLFL
jgi:hypothetical protein